MILDVDRRMMALSVAGRPNRLEYRLKQGVDAGGILDPMYSTRDPSEGGIFLNHDPLTRSATSDMTHFFWC